MIYLVCALVLISIVMLFAFGGALLGRIDGVGGQLGKLVATIAEATKPVMKPQSQKDLEAKVRRAAEDGFDAATVGEDLGYYSTTSGMRPALVNEVVQRVLEAKPPMEASAIKTIATIAERQSTRRLMGTTPMGLGMTPPTLLTARPPNPGGEASEAPLDSRRMVEAQSAADFSGRKADHARDEMLRAADLPRVDTSRVTGADPLPAGERIGVQPVAMKDLFRQGHPSDATSPYEGDGGPAANSVRDPAAAGRLYNDRRNAGVPPEEAEAIVQGFYPGFKRP